MKNVVRFLLIIPLFCVVFLVQAQVDVEDELNDLLNDIAESDGPAVSARITIDDGTWVAARGLVDVEGNEDATPDARFRIASISKTFVAVTVLRLVEEGVLDLDDRVSEWLSAGVIDDLANADEATLYQLLTMTAGIPEYLLDEFYDAVLDDPTHEWSAPEVLDFARYEDAYFDVGEGFEYVNTNYILLQLVIEEATDQDLHEVVRQYILDPLELENTYSQGQETLPGEFVHGYEDIEGGSQPEDVTNINDGVGLGDGALISTTGDLTRFYQALFVERTLLSEESLEIMTNEVENNEYGVGLEVFDSEYGQLLGHTGAVLGFTGAVYYAPDMDAIVVILYGSDALDFDHVFELLDIAEAAQ